MTEMDSSPNESDSTDEEPPRPRPSAARRSLRVVSLAAVLVAVYAFVQLRPESDGTATPGAPPSGPPGAGSVAPEIDVPLFSGGRFTLSRHLVDDGRPIFLNMWASWCFPCRAEMPDISEAAIDHPEVYFIGIAVDDREAPARDFVDKYGISYDIGFDERPIGDGAAGEGRAVEKAYTIWAMPTSYLIGSDGIIIERWFGPMRSSQIEDFIALAELSNP
jgi:thiol-disulfide isomerase/thioredoxin